MPANSLHVVLFYMDGLGPYSNSIQQLVGKYHLMYLYLQKHLL